MSTSGFKVWVELAVIINKKKSTSENGKIRFEVFGIRKLWATVRVKTNIIDSLTVVILIQNTLNIVLGRISACSNIRSLTCKFQTFKGGFNLRIFYTDISCYE